MLLCTYFLVSKNRGRIEGVSRGMMELGRGGRAWEVPGCDVVSCLLDTLQAVIQIGRMEPLKRLAVSDSMRSNSKPLNKDFNRMAVQNNYL